jgi:hypothetical protein
LHDGIDFGTNTGVPSPWVEPATPVGNAPLRLIFQSSSGTAPTPEDHSCRTASDLACIPDWVEVPGARLASCDNSFFGVVNREKPQSKQIKTFGNTNTLGLSRLWRPLEWTFTSALNSLWRPDPHDAQSIRHLRLGFNEPRERLSVHNCTLLDRMAYPPGTEEREAGKR